MSADALVVVDVQNDFCPGGALGVAGGDEVARRIAELLATAHGYRVVVATRDMHIDPGGHFSDTPDFVDTWPVHCVRGTAGVELRPELADVRVDAVFDKGAYEAAYSGFEGTEAGGDATLAEWLRASDVTSLDVVGIATDHCVRATVADALREGFVTTVRADLTAAVDPERGRAALEALAGAGATMMGQLPS